LAKLWGLRPETNGIVKAVAVIFCRKSLLEFIRLFLV
jgi:hypothetical protein